MPIRAEEFKITRRRRLADISARAVQLRETLAGLAFDERVMAAIPCLIPFQHRLSTSEQASFAR
jgi:hypothetical protein